MTKMKKKLLGASLVTLLILITLFSLKNQSKEDSVVNTKQDQVGETLISDAYKTEEIKEKETDVEVNTASTETSEINNLRSTQIEIGKETESNIEKLINQYYDVSKDFDADLLSSETKDDEAQRIELLKKKNEIIESYLKVRNFIKPGFTEDSYVVFTVYDIKFKNIETTVPGMSVLTVLKDETGKYLISNTPNDENLNNHISQQAEQVDIKNAIEDVNIRLTDAMEKDSSLKEFIEYLKEVS